MRKFGWRIDAISLLLGATTIGLPAQTFTTLASFNGADGSEPWAIVQGADMNFYGTTSTGGSSDAGVVFKVTPGGALTTLHSFCSQARCADGINPRAGLIKASDGNFYGTTQNGGSPIGGLGTVFKINAEGTLTTVYDFCSQGAPCADGAVPLAGLVQASDGSLYGTTTLAGAYNAGTVFKITPGGTLTTLHSFYGTDGANPLAALIQASDGNFYGTTFGTLGTNFCAQASGPVGTVFRITPGGTLTTLHSFSGSDGSAPSAGLIQASDGNFYGTTCTGGGNNGGTVFQITPGGNLTMLYSFCAQAACADGSNPLAGLIQGRDGNFYGTTSLGGANSAGTVFRITPGGLLTTLHSFCSQAGCADGSAPSAALIQASDGKLYGTTSESGADYKGTIFSLSIAASPALPAITGGVVNGASFQPGVAPHSWITIYGTNLSSDADNWDNAIVNGSLPTSLDGVSVSVGGEPAYIAYISPTQINALAPDTAAGTASVAVSNSTGTSSPITAVVQAAQPAFFQWPGNYAVATHQDYTPAIKNGAFAGETTTPAKPGEVITLWGTGFGPTGPSAPAGAEVPSGITYNPANTVMVTVGGTTATVYGAALAPGFAGLYQVNIQIPASLANGDYAVVATVSNTQSPSTTLITVQD